MNVCNILNLKIKISGEKKKKKRYFHHVAIDDWV